MNRTPFLTRIFACIATVLVLQTAAAQDTMVSTRASYTIKPTTDFDQRFYYTPGSRQNVWGYRGGILINEKFKLGMGGYFMNDYAVETTGTPGLNGSSEQFIVNKQLYLGTVYYEPFLVRRNFWETSLVFEAGYGRTVNTFTSKNGNGVGGKENSIWIPAGAGLSLNIKLPAFFKIECFRWIGINAMVGYRASIYKQDRRYNYNGVYWSLSGAIFLDRVFDDFHAWKKQRIITRSNKMIKLSY